MNEGYDMVIASRYLGGPRATTTNSLDRPSAIGFYRDGQLCSTAENYTDVMVIYRAYKKTVDSRFRA